MSDEGTDIHGNLSFFKLVEEFSQGNRRTAVVAFDDGCDALADVVHSRWNFEDSAAPMVVDVDGTRGDDVANGVNGSFGLGTGQQADGGDSPVPDADIGAVPRIARAVDDAAVSYEDLVGTGRLGLEAGGEQQRDEGHVHGRRGQSPAPFRGDGERFHGTGQHR